MKVHLAVFLTLLLGACACNKSAQQPAKQMATNTITPAFSADSAYHYIQQQVDFGPRIPNTPEHIACADYLANSLTRFGATVTKQHADLKAFDGTILKAINIIGAFNPEAKTRVLLFAHWDTRPWADHDADPANHKKPVLGANDGGSGVGVLLEIARQIGLRQPAIGIDIIFFDAEDYGAYETANTESSDSWCLGSQHWAQNPHTPGYRARYGILLDMVGAKNATFYREQISDYYAKHIVDKVWNTAASLGFSNYFINKRGGAITDDHLYINKLAGIPSIDIIQYDPNTENGFGDYWHTVNDTMENIDKNTLMAVGTTVLHVVYNEQ